MFNQARNIECSEARRLVEAGAQLVDVRSPQEYAQGALPGSILKVHADAAKPQ